MTANKRVKRLVVATGGLFTLLAVGFTLMAVGTPDSKAGWRGSRHRHCNADHGPGCADGPHVEDIGGSLYWLRSPEEEKRVVASLYNRYCIRCHGVDGHGVWDIPDVPDFTNAVWQASRSDAQLARMTLEGRGAVMPAFRGTLTLEEAWALARYLRTLVPGTEVSRPDYAPPKKTETKVSAPGPKKLELPAK